MSIQTLLYRDGTVPDILIMKLARVLIVAFLSSQRCRLRGSDVGSLPQDTCRARDIETLVLPPSAHCCHDTGLALLDTGDHATDGWFMATFQVLRFDFGQQRMANAP